MESVYEIQTFTLYDYINDGGPLIMWTLVTLFVIGMTITFWKLVVILLANMNTKKLLKDVYSALEEEEGIEKASHICSKTDGPVASILHAGLSRADKGTDHVEKAIVNAGAVETAFLENGLVWLATIANIAPLIGFFGTVAGMIMAFRSVALAGDVEPSLVAGGISMALITTAGGLLVAIPIQLGYNLCVWLIDKILVNMEESAGKFIDLLVDIEHKSNKEDTLKGSKK